MKITCGHNLQSNILKTLTVTARTSALSRNLQLI